MAHYGSSLKSHPRLGKTEFEILKASHKFLREEEGKNLSWDDQLASKYYDSLYREFAVCDLKHYKSGNFSLRWRTEAEVLSGTGETTCGNTRCQHHSGQYLDAPKLLLTTLELPFAYVEHGENKSALVKVVLCSKCLDKLMWKRRKEKERALEQDEKPLMQSLGDRPDPSGTEAQCLREVKVEEEDVEIGSYRRERSRKHGSRERHRHKRNSRSRSPRSNRQTSGPSHRRSYGPRPTYGD